MIQTKEFLNIAALGGVDELIDVISEKYHLTEIIIETYSEKLNWEKLSGNKTLLWNRELIEKL